MAITDSLSCRDEKYSALVRTPVQDRRSAPLMKPLRNHLSDVVIKNLSDMAGTGTRLRYPV